MAKRAAKAAKKSVAKGKAKSKSSKPEALSAGAPSNAQQSISIRKIDNGYVTSMSGYRGDKYFQRESFSKAKPKVVIGGDAK